MPQSGPPITLAGLSFAELAELASQRRLPPVERWNPPHCGHSGMQILRDGTWLHEGRPIEREAMVRLFSTILRREPDGSHVLVTPVEKLSIDVETAAFLAIGLTSDGEGHHRRIAFTLNSGDVVVLGPDHPLTPGNEIEGPRLAVRAGLEAALSRPVYYELAELALAAGASPGIWSGGTFFALEP